MRRRRPARTARPSATARARAVGVDRVGAAGWHEHLTAVPGGPSRQGTHRGGEAVDGAGLEGLVVAAQPHGKQDADPQDDDHRIEHADP